MTLDAGSRLDSGTNLPLSGAPTPGRAHRGDPEERLARLHSYFLEGSPSEVRVALEGVLADARRCLSFGSLRETWPAAALAIE